METRSQNTRQGPSNATEGDPLVEYEARNDKHMEARQVAYEARSDKCNSGNEIVKRTSA